MNATVLFDNSPMTFNASKTSETMTVLNQGDIVAVLDKPSLLWWKVAHNEFTGYMRSKYLKSENDNEIGDVVISMPRDCALALYKALEFALKN